MANHILVRELAQDQLEEEKRGLRREAGVNRLSAFGAGMPPLRAYAKPPARPGVRVRVGLAIMGFGASLAGIKMGFGEGHRSAAGMRHV